MSKKEDLIAEELKRQNPAFNDSSFSVENKDLLKQTEGKLNLTLVPRKIIIAIARVREYGNKKYNTNNPDNWKDNPRELYNEAAFRHFIAYLDDNESLDKESGLPHLHHLACNIAFLIEGGFKNV